MAYFPPHRPLGRQQKTKLHPLPRGRTHDTIYDGYLK